MKIPLGLSVAILVAIVAMSLWVYGPYRPSHQALSVAELKSCSRNVNEYEEINSHGSPTPPDDPLIKTAEQMAIGEVKYTIALNKLSDGKVYLLKALFVHPLPGAHRAGGYMSTFNARIKRVDGGVLLDCNAPDVFVVASSQDYRDAYLPVIGTFREKQK